jgi:hypothetical protein
MVMVMVMAGLIEIDWVDRRRWMVGRVDGHVTDFANLRADTESPGKFTEAVARGERGAGKVGSRKGRVTVMICDGPMVCLWGRMNKVAAASVVYVVVVVVVVVVER